MLEIFFYDRIILFIENFILFINFCKYIMYDLKLNLDFFFFLVVCVLILFVVKLEFIIYVEGSFVCGKVLLFFVLMLFICRGSGF